MMAAKDTNDPYRPPETDVNTEPPDPAARTPGFPEMLLILSSSAFVGGITFFATCIGSIVPLGLLHQSLPPAVRRHPLMQLTPFIVFLGSTAVSGYVAYRTGRAIFRRRRKSRTSSDS